MKYSCFMKNCTCKNNLVKRFSCLIHPSSKPPSTQLHLFLYRFTSFHFEIYLLKIDSYIAFIMLCSYFHIKIFSLRSFDEYFGTMENLLVFVSFGLVWFRVSQNDDGFNGIYMWWIRFLSNILAGFCATVNKMWITLKSAPSLKQTGDLSFVGAWKVYRYVAKLWHITHSQCFIWIMVERLLLLYWYIWIRISSFLYWANTSSIHNKYIDLK